MIDAIRGAKLALDRAFLVLVRVRAFLHIALSRLSYTDAIFKLQQFHRVC
jgi:hypothetical protein